MDYRLWGLLIPAKSYSKKGYPFKASVDEKAAHGYPLATMDIDIWVMPSPDNAEAVLRELRCFGALLHNLTRQDLQTDGTIFK